MTRQTCRPTRRVALASTLSVLALAACSNPAPPGTIDAHEVAGALAVLAAASQHGFATDFGAARIAALGRDKARLAERDQALHAAVIAYARAQRGLAIPAQAMPADWGLRPAPYDAEADLRQAVAQKRFKEWLAALPPQTPAYVALQQAYVAYLKAGDPRAGQVRANLERLRWLPRDEPATRVDVNTAAGLFDYVENGQTRLHMLAASGRPGDESPMLASNIQAVTLNPPWNVPKGIAEDELLPKGEDYLSSHGYTTVSDETGGDRLVQQPGPDSALGLVKFDFKNPYSVYLHDTPSKAAFNRTNRAVSHGCVRLEKAVDFARLLLGENGWPPEKVDAAIASGQTQTVALRRPVPVRLVYLTAYPLDGGVGFAPDVYGWDAKLLQLLDGAVGPDAKHL
jgi:murein L,D-transpeptidase YcbB/YkuD